MRRGRPSQHWRPLRLEFSTLQPFSFSTKILLKNLLSDLQKAICKILKGCIRKDPVTGTSVVNIKGAFTGKI